MKELLKGHNLKITNNRLEILDAYEQSLDTGAGIPDSLKDNPYYDEFVNKTLYYDSLTGYGPATELFVKTLEGPMHVSEGDYIIKGVRGELYPCKPDVFLMSYDEYTD